LIGRTTQNPPFSSLADQKDHFYGFDIDIMGEICGRLQLKCKYKPLLFNELFTEIAAKKIDLAIAAIIITPNRQQFLFSLPYLKSYARFITQKNPASPPRLLNTKK
jgi:ABC-type amino acid transport substrate-binding protein